MALFDGSNGRTSLKPAPRARVLVAAILALILVAVVGGIVSAALPRGQKAELAAVRKATAKYHDVNKAIADGYLPTDICVEEPGLGAMGYHYFNPELASDLEFDPARPELLLYAPAPDGGLKLVAVEYFAANVGQGTPSLFGQPFDGPMPGHEPGMPEHYDLHVWLWQNNPAGIFSPFNSSLSCN